MGGTPHSDSMIAVRSAHRFSAALLLSFLLLASTAAAQSDTDDDGVDDQDDDCPDTPEGDSVDGRGCSSSQRDSDGDGVANGDDQCPDTAEGANVDADGCSDAQHSTGVPDADEDGVNDAEDECTETEPGRTVNPEGCAEYQMDGDHDGVPNHEDECPETPVSERREVDGEGCTGFFDETFMADAPVVGRISKGWALSAGSASMILAGIGWTYRAGRVIVSTGVFGKRQKKRFMKRIKAARSTLELDEIRRELNKDNDKGRFPDGMFADLMTSLEQRRMSLINRSSTAPKADLRTRIRPGGGRPGR
ncbi:MAG TPA: hypothetical protein EYQ80_00390 [Candidatus Poseidoniales archaeon]|nr:hypothetical protein [Candidatus Poseidoniales archaeon]